MKVIISHLKSAVHAMTTGHWMTRYFFKEYYIVLGKVKITIWVVYHDIYCDSCGKIFYHNHDR